MLQRSAGNPCRAFRARGCALGPPQSKPCVRVRDCYIDACAHIPIAKLGIAGSDSPASSAHWSRARRCGSRRRGSPPTCFGARLALEISSGTRFHRANIVGGVGFAVDLDSGISGDTEAADRRVFSDDPVARFSGRLVDAGRVLRAAANGTLKLLYPRVLQSSGSTKILARIERANHGLEPPVNSISPRISLSKAIFGCRRSIVRSRSKTSRLARAAAQASGLPV